ncbi:MAG: molybdopterin-binding protein [Anaerolineaceae bacterium]
MPSIEIIAIGTELLLGEIQDTNTRYLARAVRDAGIDLYRATLIGDNTQRIAESILDAVKRSEIIITTGGLGPTVDDPTREAVALAAGTELEFHQELWDQILSRFIRYGRTASENNRRQAFLPHGAIGIENPVGTAPAFSIEIGKSIVISLPGVPREMEYLFDNRVLPLLRDKYALHQMILARVIHVSGVGESHIDEQIGDLELFSNPTVGLLAHPGQVDIRIAAKANSYDEAACMIQPVAEIIQKRLGNSIYGIDSDTLESVVLAKLINLQKKLIILTSGMDDSFVTQWQNSGVPVHKVHKRKKPLTKLQLKNEVTLLAQKNPSDIILACSFQAGTDQQNLLIGLLLNGAWSEDQRSYGGSPLHGAIWSNNSILDFMRRNI